MLELKNVGYKVKDELGEKEILKNVKAQVMKVV